MDLQSHLRREIKRHNLFPPNGTVLIAVSGGADSTALLHALAALRARLTITLHAATLDHRLRGDDGAADVEYVLRCAHEWGITAQAGIIDVRAVAATGNIGIEAAARQARYSFLAQVAQAIDARTVVTAHHANDQAETVLMHLIRGSGVRGLAGMRMSSSVPGFPTLRLVRPFLNVSRSEIEAYCAAHNIVPREDTSNQDTHYFRNTIRLLTLPHLQTINPQIISALGNLAAVAQTENQFIEEIFSVARDSLSIIQDRQRISIQREAFRTLHSALQRRLIAWAALQISPESEPDLTHILSAVDAGLHGQTGHTILLGSGLQFRVDYHHVIVEPVVLPSAIADFSPRASNFISVSIPGTTALDRGWSLSVTLGDVPGASARLTFPDNADVTIRTRRPGDVFAPPGLNGQHQKLSDWFINHKIPRNLRDTLPLLCVNGEIAAIITNDTWFVGSQFIIYSTHQTVFSFVLQQHLT